MTTTDRADAASSTCCPVCREDEPRPVVELSGLPVLPNATYTDADESLAATRSDIDLVVCTRCGHLYNTAFSEELATYDATYENSLHFSETFQRWIGGLADRLVQGHGLSGRSVVEIGSGPGDFLALLCDAGMARGVGFDPSFDPSRQLAVTHPAVQVTTRPFPTDGSLRADLVCSRHVLEHVPDPVELVRAATAACDHVAYHEVPNGDFMIDHTALWDLIYEHVSYFTTTSLRQLAVRAGLEITTLESSFGDQFLSLTARPGPGTDPPTPDDVAALAERATAFGGRVAETIERGRARLTDWAERGDVVLWGAGSKGISYLNLVDVDRIVAGVVDQNPRKHGTVVAGTPHRISGPDLVETRSPALVLTANPIYVDEIRARVGELSPQTEVASLW